MHKAALASLSLLSACASAPDPVDPGDSYALGGAAPDGAGWWADQTAGSGRCQQLAPDDGWSAGLDPTLIDLDDPYAGIDAGLTQVEDAVAGAQSFDPIPSDIWIEGAVIANVGSSPDSELWFADGSLVVPTVDLTGGVAGARPGDRVTFHVNAVKSDYGIAKIAGIDSFSILDRDNPIAVFEVPWSELINDHTGWLNHNISVVGELLALEGPCGGSATCYSLAGGDDQGATMTLRVSNSAPMGVGACVELIAPLGEFSDAPQFNIAAPGGDSRWIRRFF